MAPQNGFAYSSDTVAREWLRKHRWRRLGRTVPTVNDCRDLVAHFNASAEMKVGTTLTQRMQHTTRSTERLNMRSAPYDRKEEIIRGKILPKALCGCELVPINETAMRFLMTAIATSTDVPRFQHGEESDGPHLCGGH